MPKPPKKGLRRKRRAHAAQALFAFLLSVLSLATDGFGTVPNNPFSQDFRELISENLPEELIQPLNEYLAELIVPTIPAKKVVEESEIDLPDTADELAEQLAEEMAATILEEQARATAAAISAAPPQQPRKSHHLLSRQIFQPLSQLQSLQASHPQVFSPLRHQAIRHQLVLALIIQIYKLPVPGRSA